MRGCQSEEVGDRRVQRDTRIGSNLVHEYPFDLPLSPG